MVCTLERPPVLRSLPALRRSFPRTNARILDGPLGVLSLGFRVEGDGLHISEEVVGGSHTDVVGVSTDGQPIPRGANLLQGLGFMDWNI